MIKNESAVSPDSPRHTQAQSDAAVWEAAISLSAHPEFEVLKRVEVRPSYKEHRGEKLYRGLVLDCEATGLDPELDVIIEIGIVPFEYNGDGEVVRVLLDEAVSEFQDPGRPLSMEVQRITGLSDDDLAGKQIDTSRVRALVEQSHLVIAHNAAYDRPMLERLCETFKTKAWVCSMTQIDWQTEGFGAGRRLIDILRGHGLFHEAHRALDDALALMHVVASPLPLSENMPISVMRENLKTPVYKILLPKTPYSMKNAIKGLGYRWFDLGDERRGFNCEVGKEEVKDKLHETLKLLKLYGVHQDPTVVPIPMADRFSARSLLAGVRPAQRH